MHKEGKTVILDGQDLEKLANDFMVKKRASVRYNPLISGSVSKQVGPNRVY